MDFMKVLDQTVREIKREVNLKVLKVPEIKQKVLDATSDEPWGPHGSDLAEIARATKSYGECEMIMNVLWQRLGDTGANWRHVYKALAVVEYLLANGSERAVDDIIDNCSQIAKLTSFEHVEPSGKDVGLNVRKKTETVLAIIDDREKLQQIREKAAATRDKYFGLLSTGITYKSSAASFGGGSFSSGTYYGSIGSSREAGSLRDRYKGNEWGNRSKETASGYISSKQVAKEGSSGSTSYRSTKREGHGKRNQDSSNLSAANGGLSQQNVNIEDDDDFNPRGSSSAGTENASSDHVDLFGPSLIDDLVDTTSSSIAMSNTGPAAVPEFDLFAPTAFQSANAPLETAKGSQAQEDIGLFADRSSFAGSVVSDTEFSIRGNPNKSSMQNLSFLVNPSGSALSESLHEKSRKPEHSKAAVFDPFTAIRAKSFHGSDSFDAFSSNTSSVPTEQRHNPAAGIKSCEHSPLDELNYGAFTSQTESPIASAMPSTSKAPTKLEPAAMAASKSDSKKGGTFQVKSGVWAESLSRGLINLNIAAPKKVDLSDVGVVGRLSDGSDEKRSADSWYSGAAMGTGSGLGISSFPSSAGTNFQQKHFAGFN